MEGLCLVRDIAGRLGLGLIGARRDGQVDESACYGGVGDGCDSLKNLLWSSVSTGPFDL